MVEFAAQPASAKAHAAAAIALLAVFLMAQPNAIDRFPSPGLDETSPGSLAPGLCCSGPEFRPIRQVG
jgi:hypothetical protein